MVEYLSIYITILFFIILFFKCKLYILLYFISLREMLFDLFKNEILYTELLSLICTDQMHEKNFLGFNWDLNRFKKKYMDFS